MKKLMGMLLIIALSLSALAGCGKTGSENAGKIGGEINLYYWDNAQKVVMDKIIEGFNKQYPEAKVNTTVIPWDQYWLKLQTSLPSGTGPDVFWMNGPNAPSYVQKGLLEDLTDRMAKDSIDLGNYTKSVVQLYTFNDKTYAIPKDKDTIGLFYNKDLFDKAGLPYPDDTWTWDTLLANAQKLTGNGNYGFVAASTMNSGLGNFIYQAGGSIYSSDGKTVTINSSEAEKAVQYMVDMMYKYKVSPTAAEQQENNGEALFESGKLAMISDGCWMATTFEKSLGNKLEVAPLPKGAQRAAIAHGIGFVMNSKSKNKTTAWAFLKYCSTKEAQEAQSSVVIPAYIGAEQNWENGIPGVNLKVFVDALNSYSIPYPVAAKNSSEVDTAFNKEISNIWFQSKDVKKGLADAEKAMNETLQK